MQTMILTGTHDGYLVMLSLLIAAFASFTALSLGSRVRASSGAIRRIWVASAAIALGGGIWSMHFVAMLAFSVPGMEMSYSPSLTLLSLLIAVVFTGAGFAIMRWDEVSLGQVAWAGLLMGSGVLAMHYLGMAAMRMPASLSYERFWVAVSMLVAIGAATAAVWLAARDQRLAHRLVAAAAMGTAIAGMHYAGMRAAVFTAAPTVDMATARASIGQTNLAVVISAITVLILIMALGAARVERLLQALARREARAALRLKIADVLRESDTAEALQEVAALMGVHFGVSRAGYGELDPADDSFQYGVCWTDGSVPALMGRYPAADFGVKIVAMLQAGRTVAIDDLLRAALSDEARTHQTARDVDTRAILVVPFVRDRQLRGIVYMNQRTPRSWHPDEIAFVEEIAERTRLVIERAMALAQLRELNATLEARVEARTRQLREAQEALLQSQKMEAVGQLVAGLAHDFNNVLGAVVGAFDLIQGRPAEPARVQRFAQAGLQAAERGAKLTAQLLAFSRTQRIQLQPLLVCVVIAAMQELLARTLGPAIQLQLQPSPAPAPVMADPTQLEMMVLNLAINARDAMPDGGVVSIGTRVRHIAGDPEMGDGRYVELTVRDSGTGMDETTLRRAMEPFFTTKPVGKGTGLGLAQIYGSARQAGGTVRIESALGAGTTVRVFLPCTDRLPVAAATIAAPAPVPGDVRVARVLLVDDDPHLRQMLASALEAHGYGVREANDGPSALEALAAELPDVAVIDFAMPGMNGAELARRVAERWPSLPLLFASGFADTAAVDAATDGKAVLLRKPFRVEELVTAIDQAIA
ncbi:MHYT domain-containing protein [Frateuria soli]|uniref:MHYT domain-containing protein n=1 Tax=Frateuria soli TaxID=1542730 RepID=UPI001E414FE8|nr:MHYT domain-containing protein [Frateuria soli]UGB38187.1 response regulator [Frateuria soli]